MPVLVVAPVWSNLKRSLANLVKQDIGQLTALVKTRLRRMQYQPGLVPTGLYHELYLSDVRETAPQKMRTIMRQPARAA